MKKVIYFLFLVPVVFLLVGCGKEAKNLKTIELKDEEFGYSTVFSFNEKEKYTEPETDTSGKSVKISFENEEADAEIEMYYVKMRKTTYENSKSTRSSQKYYKEYKFGDFNSYAYGEYDSGIYLNTVIDTVDDDVVIIFTSISRIDVNEEVIMSEVLEKKLQDFFKSMKVEKLK